MLDTCLKLKLTISKTKTKDNFARKEFVDAKYVVKKATLAFSEF